MVGPGSWLKPGNYILNITQTGFKPIKRKFIIWPIAGKVFIKEKLEAKEIVVHIDVKSEFCLNLRDARISIYPIYEVASYRRRFLLRPEMEYQLRIQQKGYQEYWRKIYLKLGEKKAYFHCSFS